MVALVSRPREIFTDDTPVPATFMRQPRPPFFPYKVAMHWDGTYRDRVAYCRDYAVSYWTDTFPDRITAVSVKKIAKHLA